MRGFHNVKHETIPTRVLMPGRDDHAKKDNRLLNRLVRLLHRTHHGLFQGLPQVNGFRLSTEAGMKSTIQNGPVVLPSFEANVTQCETLDLNCAEYGELEAARELHSTRLDENGPPPADPNRTDDALAVVNSRLRSVP